MRRLVLVFMTTVALLLALPGAAAAQEDPCASGEAFGEFHADMAMSGAIPEEHLPGEHFGFAGLCLQLEPLPDTNPGT